MQPREIELLAVKESALKAGYFTSNPISNPSTKLQQIDGLEMQLLDFQETMGRLKEICDTCASHMVIYFRRTLVIVGTWYYRSAILCNELHLFKCSLPNSVNPYTVTYRSSRMIAILPICCNQFVTVICLSFSDACLQEENGL